MKILRTLTALTATLTFATSALGQKVPAADAFGAADEFDVLSEETTELEDLHQFLDLNLKLGELTEAKKYATRILVRSSRDADALAALLGIHLKQKKAQAALASAVRYRAVRPGAEADALYASALRLNSKFDEALSVMEKRQREAKGHFPQLLELCYCYTDTRQIEKAEACFKMVASNERFSAKERAEARKGLAAINREREIKKAYVAIDQRDLEQARSIATELAKEGKKPNRDVVALTAVLDADEHGKVDEAVATLEKLKAEHKGDKPFPYLATLAVLLQEQGRFADAEEAAQAAVDAESPHLTPEERAARLDALRSVAQQTRPTLALDGKFQDAAEGTALRGRVKASMALGKQKRTRVGAEYRFNELDLKNGGGDSYHGVLATVSHQFNAKVSGRAAVGAIAGKLAYQAALRLKRPGREDFVEAIIEGGHRPKDSIALESMNSRERRVSVKGQIQVPTNRRIRLSGEVYGRDINVAGAGKIGSGWGARWEAEYTFYKLQRTTISAAYVGAFEQFDHTASGEAFRGLVEDDLHSHGLVLRARAALSENLLIHGEVGASYRFDDSQMAYSVAAGLEYWLSDFTRLDINGAYYTSGKAGNAGSGYFEGRIGLTTSF